MRRCRVWHSERARALRSLLLLSSVAAVIVAAPAEIDRNPSLTVSVRLDGKLSTDPVYIGLVPMDQSPGHPLRETVTSTGRTDLTAPAGTYGLMTAANGFDSNLRQVEIRPGARNEITIDLAAVPTFNGVVSDTEGNPIAGALVSYAPAASVPSLADMSALLLQHSTSSLRATTDENGRWQLPAARFPLLIEASGWTPAWVMPKTSTSPTDVFLRKGSSLRVTLDRMDPSIVVSAIPLAKDEYGVPERARRLVWGREASTPSLDWISLPAGDYKVVASYPDPARFAPPVEIGKVTLVAGDSASVRVTLPPERAATASYVSLRVPPRTDLSELRAFAREPGGARTVRHATREALGGKIIFVDSPLQPADVYLTTHTELITASSGPPRAATKAVDAVRIARGEGRLRVVPAEGVSLPQVATVAFSSCIHKEQIALPVDIFKDGVLRFPLLVPCQAFTLTFAGAGSLGLNASVAPGEEKWLGDHTLTAAAAAEVHAVYAGAVAAGVVVRATVLHDRQTVPVGEAIADERGIAVLDGLPAGDVTFEARLGETQHAGSTTVTLQPGKQTLVDPLEIPEPASLTIAAEFDPVFKSENPTAALFGVSVELEGNPNESRKADLRGKSPETTFDDLPPGTWRVVAMVEVDEIPQPIEVDRVEVRAGEQKRVRSRIKPLIFTGQVFSNDRGVAALVGIGDQPGPNAVRRDIRSTSDGRFKVVLPQEGFYRVSVTRTATADPIDVGSVAFQAASPSVRIDLPDSELAVQVRNGDTPAAGASILATLRVDSPAGQGPKRVTRKATTDDTGAATLADLQPGTWIVEARDRSGRTAEKMAAVSRGGRARATLQLSDPNQFQGVVIDERGQLAAGASIDCIFAGTGGSLRAVHGEADYAAAFSIPLPNPAPSRLDCGVSTASGAIGAFITAPGERVELALPQAAGSVTIADWGERVIPDRFWLAASDGRVFNLSWAAKKFGRMWSPLTIGRLPSGQWNVVRADSTAALTAIALGTARALPVVADIRVDEGQAAEIHIQAGTVNRQ
jgi:hypothetical protein